MPDQTVPVTDVTVTNHGSIFTFALHTDAAREWWADFVGTGEGEGLSFCGQKVVEHRFAHDLAEGMQAGGLVVA